MHNKPVKDQVACVGSPGVWGFMALVFALILTLPSADVRVAQFKDIAGVLRTLSAIVWACSAIIFLVIFVALIKH